VLTLGIDAPPESLRDLVVGTIRWQLRLNAYLYLLTDQYPPFSLT